RPRHRRALLSAPSDPRSAPPPRRRGSVPRHRWSPRPCRRKAGRRGAGTLPRPRPAPPHRLRPRAPARRGAHGGEGSRAPRGRGYGGRGAGQREREEEMDQFADIDLDSEAVWLDGAWYTRDDLARKIKQLIETGDYR